MIKLEKFLRTHPRAEELDFVRSEQTLFEILPKGTNKGTLLPHFENLLGINGERIIAVSDCNNDIGMICAAGIGVAVSNAVHEAVVFNRFAHDNKPFSAKSLIMRLQTPCADLYARNLRPHLRARAERAHAPPSLIPIRAPAHLLRSHFTLTSLQLTTNQIAEKEIQKNRKKIDKKT